MSEFKIGDLIKINDPGKEEGFCVVIDVSGECVRYEPTNNYFEVFVLDKMFHVNCKFRNECVINLGQSELVKLLYDQI